MVLPPAVMVLLEDVVVVVAVVFATWLVLAPVFTLDAAALAQPAKTRQANGNNHNLKLFFIFVSPWALLALVPY